MNIDDDIMSDKDILLEYARERMLNEDKEPDWMKKAEEADFRPEDFGDFPKDEKSLISALGRKWKVNLCLMGSFFDEYKYITSNYLKDYDFSPFGSDSNDCPSDCDMNSQDEVPCKRHPQVIQTPLRLPTLVPTFDFDEEKSVAVLNLSVKNKNLLSIYGCKTNVETVIDMLLKVKGLVCLNKARSVFVNGKRVRRYEGVRYVKGGKRKGKCRKFAYNKVMEKLVLALVKKYDLNLVHANRVMDGDADIAFDPALHYNIKVSPSVRIAHCTDEMCKKVLSKRYAPLLADRLRKINLMNETLPSEERISFDWNIRRSEQGFITKIGIRASSMVSSYKDDEKTHKNTDGKWRRDYLKRRFGIGGWIEFDTTASIYQLTRLLNKGEWLGNGNGDPYAFMFGEDFFSKADRTTYKDICMAIYFDSTASIVNHNRHKTPESLERYGEDTIASVLQTSKDAMWGFTGDFLGSEVFLHESLMYIDFVWELRQMGVEVVQIYDGFYLRDGSVSWEELNDLMGKCATDYLKDYREWLAYLEQLNGSVSAIKPLKAAA